MKARINYKSRQTIIIMSIAVVLLIAAITGTVAFVKGNRNVAAAMKNENRQTVENSEDNSRTNISIADNGNLNNNETGNNSDNGKVLPNTGDNANPIDIGQNGNNGENNGATIENDGTKVADTGNTPSTTTENGSVAGNSSSNNSSGNSTSGNQNGNTSTSTTTGEANVPNQEYTQTTVIPGRENVLVEQNTEIGWSPISIKAFDIATKLKVHVNKFPDINTIKTSEGKHKDGTPVTKENPLHELDTITYTLTVKNIGNGKGTVKISDTVPEGTTLVTDSIKCGENTYTEAELNAGIEVLLEGGEEKYVTFTVTINPFEDEKITVRNAEAKQDENPVPPTDDEVVKEYVSIDVNKEFIDKENVEELRPTDVVVALYERENDETYIDTRTLNEQNGWKESFTGLDKYDLKTKELIEYDIRELNVDENYTASYDKNQEQNNITLKITNTLKYENISTSVTVNKIWIDPENIVRPEVTINLYQNGSEDVFASYTLKNGETSHEFTNLPKYDDDGNEYVYTAEEAEVNGYTAEYSNDTLTITNTIDQENTVSISGTKTWIAPEGIEHPTIKINLFQNEQLYDSVKLENGTTSYLFSNLPKYRVDENGKYELDENGRVQLNEYTVEEENVEGYTSTKAESKVDFINTINQEKVTINGTKTWIDPKDTVHSAVVINLIRDNNKIDTVILTNGTTSYQFKDLDKYAPDGHIYKYTIVEENVEGYTPSYSGEYNEKITNTINQDNTVSVTGIKNWIDPQGTEHPEITIRLIRDDVQTEKFVTLKNGEKDYSFTGLEKYAPDGHIYKYTVKEDKVDGYETTYGENIITNTINQEKITINGTKTWIDPEKTVHSEITINLMRDNIKFDTVKLSNGTTSYEFKNLDKYAPDGHIYNYTIVEESVEGYTTSYSGEYNENITNTINQEKVAVNGEKKWIAPVGTTFPTITINLLQDGNKITSKELPNGTTSYVFDELDRYDLTDGHEYVYTVSEEKVEGYTTSYSEDRKSLITNTIKQKYKTISGTKTWIDPQGTVHPNIIITLYRNGKEYKAVTLESGKTTYEFTDLETYAPDGSIYNYTVEETVPEKYTSKKAANGFDFINTIKQEHTSVNGTKTWVAPAGTTFPTITIRLFKDGTEINSKELPNGTTSYLFDKLDKYDLTDGHEYVYTVTEDKVEGYKSEQNGNNFINTIEQDNTVVVGGNKTWITPAGITKPTVTIKLLKNGEEFKTTTIENGNTTYEFIGLPRYKTDNNGNYILDNKGNVELNEYTVEEVSLDGYTSTQNGFDFVNTINQELISINGEKTWVDPEGTELFHPEITINLLKNGIKDKTIKLTNGNTKYEFTGLPKYQVDEDGHYILDNNGNVQLNQYRVEEEVVQNYETSYDGYNITNTFKQDIQGTVEITTTKTSETSVKTPLDVAFVLDVSGSMNDNDKDKTMVDSVNSAISTIMKENPDSRVGVVAYSSKENSNYSNNSNAITLLPLGKYTPKSDEKYLTIKDDTYTITWRDEWGIPQSATYDKDIISTNVNEVASISLNVYGGTYTQTGIKAGADILTSASTKYTTKVNGKDKEVMRTPVIILLSDGDPTYYNKNYQSLTGDRSGTGNSTSENDAYYTIRTADYYKKQVTSHYYGTTGTKSKFYTIGLNMSGTLSKTILDPSSTNVNLCNSEGTAGTGWNKTRNVKGKLYDKIISDGSADKYSYADKSYVGSMTASDLQGIFNTIINDSTTSTEKRDITLEESNNRRVDLEGIDTSKAFRLIIGNTSYNFAQAKASDYVKGNDTDGYYVDLSKVAKGSTITISYNK